MKRLAPFLVVPALGLVLVLTAALRRPTAGPTGADRPTEHRRQARTSPRRDIAPRPDHLPATASAATVARNAESIRLQSTFDNFRTAVATDNVVLQRALKPTLLRDRKAALRLAEAAVKSSTDPADAAVARRTLFALRSN